MKTYDILFQGAGSGFNGRGCQYEVYGTDINDTLIRDLANQIAGTLMYPFTEDDSVVDKISVIIFQKLKDAGIKRSRKNIIIHHEWNDYTLSASVDIFDSEIESQEYYNAMQSEYENQDKIQKRYSAAIRVLVNTLGMSRKEAADAVDRELNDGKLQSN